MTVLPTQYCLSSRNFKHGSLITSFPSKNLLQTLGAIWVVALMYYNCVFPKVKICGYLNKLIHPMESPLTPKGLIKSIKTKFSQIIFTSIFWKPFLNFQPFLLLYNSLKLVLYCQTWISKIPIKFKRGTTMLDFSLLRLQSPSQVVTQYPLFLVSPKIETKQYLNPISCIAPFQTLWVQKIDN